MDPDGFCNWRRTTVSTAGSSKTTGPFLGHEAGSLRSRGARGGVLATGGAVGIALAAALSAGALATAPTDDLGLSHAVSVESAMAMTPVLARMAAMLPCAKAHSHA